MPFTRGEILLRGTPVVKTPTGVLALQFSSLTHSLRNEIEGLDSHRNLTPLIIFRVQIGSFLSKIRVGGVAVCGKLTWG